MSVKIEINGIVYKKGEPETKNNYTKQEMILHVPDLNKDDYSDYFRIEWNTNGIKTLQEQKIKDKDHVKVVAYLNGKKWIDKDNTERFFNSFSGYKIEKTDGSAEAQVLTPFPILDNQEELTDDDLPF